MTYRSYYKVLMLLQSITKSVVRQMWSSSANGERGFGGLKACSRPYSLSVTQNLVLSHGNVILSSTTFARTSTLLARKRRVELP